MIKKPDFFIVGAPKCGTTAMDQYLSLRPDIFMARKEMHFFGLDLHFGNQFYRRDEAAYLAEFEGWQGQRRGGESSVWYLFSTQAAAEIKAFNPEARIIIMLRDPVEMLHSMYYTFFWDGNEQLPTFEEALLAQDDRRAGKRIARQTYFVQGLLYNEIVRYSEQVKRYFNVFGKERVHVIIYDDFAANVGAACRETLNFLEVDSSSLPTDFKAVNENKFVKSHVLRALLADRVVRSAVLAVRPLLPRVLFDGMQKIDARIRKFNSRPGGRPPLSLELRHELQRAFVPEVERLSVLLGRDLTHWSRNESRHPRIPQTPPNRTKDAAPLPPNPQRPRSTDGGQDRTVKSTACV